MSLNNDDNPRKRKQSSISTTPTTTSSSPTGTIPSTTTSEERVVIQADNTTNTNDTTNTKDVETKCPHDIFMDNLNSFLADYAKKHDDYKGTMLIRGLNQLNDDEEDEIEDDDDDDEDNSRYTMEQMQQLRYIIMTTNRNHQVEEMENIIFGSQANIKMELFNTSFSYKVMNSWYKVKSRLQRKNTSPSQKLDILFAYTCTLLNFDTWIHDNEGGMDALVKGLGAAWKRLFKNYNDEALQWDVEYTKPGVMELLRRFGRKINVMEDYYDLGKFQYE